MAFKPEKTHGLEWIQWLSNHVRLAWGSAMISCSSYYYPESMGPAAAVWLEGNPRKRHVAN